MTADARRRVIITADDFGLDIAVNEAVEQAYRHGILTTASLMVGAPAASDAVRRAQALPGLKVGLHLVLADGSAILPPARIPDLVDAAGRFHDNMAAAGARFFFRPVVRRQLAAEIRAQFAAFAATGLALDHVNAHKHFHLHPTVARLALIIGRDYGLTAMRLPREPWFAGLGGAKKYAAPRVAGALLLTPWLAWMQHQLKARKIASNDHVFGLSASGHMHEHNLLRILDRLPAGVSEIYCHPATRTGLTASMAGYDHPGELAALVSPRVAAALENARIQRIGFADLYQSP